MDIDILIDINMHFCVAFQIQSISIRNGLYKLALMDKDMLVRFGLKMVLEC